MSARGAARRIAGEIIIFYAGLMLSQTGNHLVLMKRNILIYQYFMYKLITLVNVYQQLVVIDLDFRKRSTKTMLNHEALKA